MWRGRAVGDLYQGNWAGRECCRRHIGAGPTLTAGDSPSNSPVPSSDAFLDGFSDAHSSPPFPVAHSSSALSLISSPQSPSILLPAVTKSSSLLMRLTLLRILQCSWLQVLYLNVHFPSPALPQRALSGYIFSLVLPAEPNDLSLSLCIVLLTFSPCHCHFFFVLFLHFLKF